MKEVVAKDAFSQSMHPPIYAIVHAIMVCKKHQRSCTVQEEGLIKEGRHLLLLLHKQVHNKRGHCKITACVRTCKYRARLTACEVGVFLREITPKNTLTPLFEELKFITQKHILERLW